MVKAFKTLTQPRETGHFRTIDTPDGKIIHRAFKTDGSYTDTKLETDISLFDKDFDIKDVPY